MTGMLRSVLREQADSTDSPVIDLDEIVRTGDRRIRRRRAGVGLAAAAVAGVLAASALVVPGLRGGTDGLTAGPSAPFAERKVGYALDNVIHWGDQAFTMDTTVGSYVQTDDGFVYTSADKSVWLYDGRTSERVGHASGRLEADTSGSLVAWTDFRSEPEYVVFDTAARHEVVRVEAPSEPSVYALDDGSAYWRTAEGIVRYDITTGSSDLLWHWSDVEDPSAKPPAVSELVDAAAGRLAYDVQHDSEWGLAVGGGIVADARPLAQATNGSLSPDGNFLAAEENDYIAVYDTATGEPVTPDVGGYPYAVAYAWVDKDTAMVFALEDIGGDRKGHPADFLACDVPSGNCTVVRSDRVTLRLVLPIGMPAT